MPGALLVAETPENEGGCKSLHVFWRDFETLILHYNVCIWSVRANLT